MKYEVKFKKIGKDMFAIIPRKAIKKLGWNMQTLLDVKSTQKGILIAKVKSEPSK